MSDYFQAIPSQSVALTNASNTTSVDALDASGKIALTIAEAGSDRKAGDIILLKVADISYLADYFVMMSGYSRVQVRAIAEAVEEQVKTECGRSPLRTEGKAEGSWVLIDYGEVIVHIMMPKEREFYNLEAFWGHGTRIDLTTSDQGGGKPT
ncbi:ribosome silencing factor [Iningainema tapete]|uniref:Ribosomal silencing factor RsfS n=1 Tax=Iningainema tapete BLCC-T55 TaxID=2748662 RepID=A0A8J7C861_9CYAN|nr:ribosome silencing factor [Iningainema tapete]MBD2776609.1 ribosome silencing factor [Iningainema tapete BLCC-T55]